MKIKRKFKSKNKNMKMEIVRVNENSNQEDNQELLEQKKIMKFLSNCSPWVHAKAYLAYSNKEFQINIILHKNRMCDAILELIDDRKESCYLPINSQMSVKFNINYLALTLIEPHDVEVVFELNNEDRQCEFLISQLRLCRKISKFINEFNVDKNDAFLKKYAKPDNFDPRCELFDIDAVNCLASPVPFDGDAFKTWSERSNELNSSFFTLLGNLKIMCMTWNVGSASPENDETVEKQIVDFINGDYDILFFAFQEIDMSFQTVVSGNCEASGEWTRVLSSCFIIDGRYTLAYSISLGGVFSAVGVKKKIVDPFGNKINVTVKPPEQVRLGFHGALANKSGILYTIDAGYNGHIMLVGCHLAAHQESSDQRNEMLVELIGHMKKNTDYFILIGDLNYRLDLPFEEVIDIIENEPNPSEILLKHDQLMKARASVAEICHLIEGEIKFNPTYKFDVGVDIYDTGPKHRTPSYTDRVLSKMRDYPRLAVNRNDNITFETDIANEFIPNYPKKKNYLSDEKFLNYPVKQKYLEYKSGTCKISDHRPVKGVISVGIPISDPEMRKDFRDILIDKVNEIKFLSMPKIVPGSQEIEIKAHENKELEFKNDSYAWAKWSLKFDESSDSKICRITPNQGIVLPGKAFTIRISAKKQTTRNKPLYIRLQGYEGMLAQITVHIN